MRRILFFTILGILCTISLSYSGGGCTLTFPIFCPGDGGEVVDLTDFWRDADKSGLVAFSIVQDGVIVTSTRLAPRVCDHEDGTGATSQSMEDFTGVISGCSIIGQIEVCRFGFDPLTVGNGIIKAELDATINLAQDRINGTFSDPVTGRSGTATWERLGCQPKAPEDYLLPGTEIIAFITAHNLALGMITYGGQAPLGIEITRRVVSGVSGAVATVTPGSATDPTIIGVIVGNGNRIEYSLFGAFAVAMVSPGTAVDPSTVIGTIGEGTGPSGEPEFFMLQLRAFEVGTDAPINPDCVEQ